MRFGRVVYSGGRSAAPVEPALQFDGRYGLFHAADSPEGRTRTRIADGKKGMRACAETVFVCIGAVATLLTGGLTGGHRARRAERKAQAECEAQPENGREQMI